MRNLELIKSAMFGEIPCDVYSDSKEMYMTAEQLGNCLGYAEARRSIGNLLKRNDYLENKEFSAVIKLMTPQGTKQNTRIFTEDGIYEITFLSKTAKAKEFRAWVRTLLKSLRKGETKIVGMTEYQKMMVQTRNENTKVRKAQILARLSGEYEGAYKQVLQAYATRELTGEFLIPLPQLEKRTYSATEIGKILGISANRVGILANRNGLKTEKYGAWFHDTAKHYSKEVQSFRYYENVIPVLQKCI